MLQRNAFVRSAEKKNNNKIKKPLLYRYTEMCYIINVFRYKLSPVIVCRVFAQFVVRWIIAVRNCVRSAVKPFTVSRPQRLRSSRRAHAGRTNDCCVLTIDSVDLCFSRFYFDHKVGAIEISRVIQQLDEWTIRSSTISFAISKLLVF